MSIVYLDNAATSHPKPESVYRACDTFQRSIGAGPGRSAHRLGLEAGRIVLDARERLAELFAAPDSARVILLPSCTAGLNLAIKGLLLPGGHVVTSSMEHNSMMRPLRGLEQRGGVEVTAVSCSREGLLDPGDVADAIRPNTRLIAVNHASNVVGTIQPVADIGRLAKARGIPFLVDAAQSAGTVPIDMAGMNIGLLAFSGHKGLLGPQGTGGLVIGEGIEPLPLIEGGTGSNSHHEVQPAELPDRYESGTPNGPGIAGLAAGVEWVQERGVEAIGRGLSGLIRCALEELAAIGGVTVYGPKDPARQTAAVSFTMEGFDTSELGLLLDERYGIMVRTGLHCAPGAHRTIGSFRRTRGTVRVSFGPMNTIEHVRYMGQCLRELADDRDARP